MGAYRGFVTDYQVTSCVFLVGPIYVLNAATPQITGLKVIPRLSLNVGVHSPATGSCVTTTHPLPHNLASVTGSICPM